MSPINGFPFVATPSARVLILGSMPGKPSLKANEYYANRQNVFWRIMGDLFEAGPEIEYGERLQKLQAAGVALWDVIASCKRESSKDSDILAASVRVNDFSDFFANHPSVERVCFNGQAAEKTFRHHVMPHLRTTKLQFCLLPSTSPLYTIPYEKKRDAWSIIKPSNKSSAGSV